MGKDRIQIDGEWYVKESSVEPVVEVAESEITWCKQAIYERDDFCFVVSRLVNEKGEEYGETVVEFTDKRPEERRDWVEHYLDNDQFLQAVINKDRDAECQCNEFMSKSQYEHMRQLLSLLSRKGWSELQE